MNRLLSLLAAAAIISTAGIAGAQETTREQRIEAHQKRIQQIIADSRAKQQQAGSIVPATTVPTAPATPAQVVSTPSEDAAETTAGEDGSRATTSAPIASPGSPAQTLSLKDAVVQRNMEKVNQFYQRQNVKELSMRGQKQEYKDDAISVAWSYEAPGYKLNYQWAGQPEQTAMVPGKGDYLLRSGAECVIFRPVADSLVRILRWTQPDVIVSHDEWILLLTPDHPQTMNGWTFSYDGNLVIAAEKDSGTTIPVGSTFRDSRPVGKMVAVISIVTSATRTIGVDVEPTQGTDLNAGALSYNLPEFNGSGSEQVPLAQMAEQLAKLYSFNITWEGEGTSETEQVKQQLTSHGSSSSNNPVVSHLNNRLTPYVAAEIIDKRNVLIRIDPVYSNELRDKPAAIQALETSYPLSTKLYKLQQLSAATVEPLVAEKLGWYFVWYSNTKPPRIGGAVLSKAVGSYGIWRASLLGHEGRTGTIIQIADKKESMVIDEKADILLVTATAQTHAAVAEFLEGLDTLGADSTVSARPVATQRHRIQAVLLQGGKAGEAVPDAATLTYTPDIATRFGMTPEDLKILGFDGAAELGRSIIDIVADPGQPGKATITLGGPTKYTISLQYEDQRKPYFLFRATLSTAGETEPLAENTVFLEKDKPQYLGVTNLSGAVIVVLTML